VGLLKDLADKGKAAARKFTVRFTPETAPGPTVVPPTEAAVLAAQAQQPAAPTEKPRSRSGSTASGSFHSNGSDTFDIVRQDEKQIKTAVSQGSLQTLRQSFYVVNQFWGKSSKKNINITPEHREAFDYVLACIEGGEVTDNAALREEPDTAIISGFLLKWSNARVLKTAAVQSTPPQPTWNPFRWAARGVHSGVSAAASVFSSSNSVSVPRAEILTQDFIQYLIDLFAKPLADIRQDAKTNILLKLSRWPAGLIASPPELGISVNNQRLSETVLIQPCVEALQRIYQQTVRQHEEDSFRADPKEFFKGACLALHTYYAQLKKVNTYLQANRNNAYLWGHPNIQQALSYYFEQGKYLYEIHAMVQNVPVQDRANKIRLMDKYENYIKEMYAREAVFTRTSGPFAFGFDKWTKIEAAMEQYRYLRGLPEDVYPQPPAERLLDMQYAGEQGRLKDLKAQGLYLGYGRGNSASDPFVPLNMPTRLEPMRL
jgi:hypothetical protein